MASATHVIRRPRRPTVQELMVGLGDSPLEQTLRNLARAYELSGTYDPMPTTADVVPHPHTVVRAEIYNAMLYLQAEAKARQQIVIAAE